MVSLGAVAASRASNVFHMKKTKETMEKKRRNEKRGRNKRKNTEKDVKRDKKQQQG